MDTSKLRRIIREETRRLDENASFPKTFTVDMHLATTYYKRIAERIVENVKQAASGMASVDRITRSKALRGAYHIAFTGYSRSDIEVRVHVSVFGIVNDDSVIRVQYEGPRGSDQHEEAFDVSATPNAAVRGATQFIKSALGVSR